MLRLQPTELKQRYPLYEDIEALITVGFLSHPVKVNGVSLNLRSLGPGDLFLMRARLLTDEDWKLWLIASSVWMVDGFSLLGDTNAAPWILRKLKHIPKESRKILLSLVTGLFSRQSKALEGTESYCYETASGYLWKSYGGHVPSLHTGIPGMEKIGTNHVQRMWTFYNEVEDKRLEEDSAWEAAKLVASTQSPKGVKKIDAADKAAHQKEQLRRQEVQDRFYYLATGVLKPEDIEAENKLKRPLETKTVDDLAQEMYRWVTGDEDEHDKVVREYKQAIIDRHAKEKEARERRALEFRRRLDQEMPNARSTPLVAYTQEQLTRILRDRDRGYPTAGGTKTVIIGTKQSDHVYTKCLEREPDSAGVVPTSDGRLVDGVRQDLTERVVDRKVPLDVRQEE